MERIYNKLVRDEIPGIIEKNGEKAVIRILDHNEYKRELEKKLLEEYEEVLKAKIREDRIEELADMLEVISALLKIEKSTIEECIEKALTKRDVRGGFDKRIYLEKVIDCE